ncbi:MAG: tyrosinase family protein [Bacteroidota bacterium]
MKTKKNLNVRHSLIDLQIAYEKGDKKPLENLMRAWKGVKELPPEDPKSFFMLGGFHGEPFRAAGATDTSYWGGYCNHGNVLFPTWHRAYLVKLEESLQSIKGCEEVTIPFWDETNAETLANGVPWALTNSTFTFSNGETIDNPLKSFTLPVALTDNAIDPGTYNYSKPAGYETVRYPYSGLVGTPEDAAATAIHNAKYPASVGTAYLNDNIINWLTESHKPNTTTHAERGYVLAQFKNCLNAPNYTVFSNTTSAGEWNSHLDPGVDPITPLESPHNSIHLAVGGFDAPGYRASRVAGANGDMGENNTAGLDPIFFFHHCNVDRMFWLWQKKHQKTESLDLIEEYPGTNSSDGGTQPSVGQAPNSYLTLDSPLYPFKKSNKAGDYYTSNDCVNINNLGYEYGKGSLDELAKPLLKAAAPAKSGGQLIKISKLNRAARKGSFVIAAYTNVTDKDGNTTQELLGFEAVLSRWSVMKCANCLTHLETKAFFKIPNKHPLNLLSSSEAANAITISIIDRDGPVEAAESPLQTKMLTADNQETLYQLEIL